MSGREDNLIYVYGRITLFCQGTGFKSQQTFSPSLIHIEMPYKVGVVISISFLPFTDEAVRAQRDEVTLLRSLSW